VGVGSEGSKVREDFEPQRHKGAKVREDKLNTVGILKAVNVVYDL